MSSQNSGLKWLLGCGVAALLMLLICGGLAVYLVSRGAGWFWGAIQAEQQRAEFAASWQPPPSGAGPDRLFPANVAEFELLSHDRQADVPDFGIDLAGHHATYQSPQMKLDVFVYRATKLEKEALFRRVEDAIQQNDYNLRMRFGSSQGDRFSYTVSPPRQKGSLWWSKDWLFFFRTDGSEDLEPFLEAYLSALAQGTRDDEPATGPM